MDEAAGQPHEEGLENSSSRVMPASRKLGEPPELPLPRAGLRRAQSDESGRIVNSSPM